MNKTQEEVFTSAKKILPPGAVHVSGGLPDTRGVSDVDVSIFSQTPHDLLSQFPPGTTSTRWKGSTIYTLPGFAREVNVYATNDRRLFEMGRQHRETAIALAEKYPHLAREATALKKKGMSTEPAWAQVLGAKGDPYEAMTSKTNMLQLAEKKDSKLEKAKQL